MLVRDIMHAHPVTIQKDTKVGEAAGLLERLSVRHLPVLDGTRLVAMVSDRDFRELLSGWTDDESRQRYAEQSVEAIASSALVTVTGADDVTDAVDTMIDSRVGALPVVDEQQMLIGIVSYVDVLRAIGEHLD